MSLPNVWSSVKVLLSSAAKVPARQRVVYGLALLVLVVGGEGQARSQFMYFSEAGSGEIRRANLDGTGLVTLISGSPFGPTLDLTGGQMYWADNVAGAIMRANLDGSGQTTLVSGLPPAPPGPPSFTPPILDLAHGHMYWTDGINSGPGDIRRANLDGSEQMILVTGLNAPRGLALDPFGGQMYWAEGGASGKIWRANLDGSGMATLLEVAPGPFAVALDIAGGKMYFARIVAGDIQRANLDGSGQEILVRNPDPAGIALDLAGGKMYWTNVFNGDIRRANLDGTGEILIKGLNGPGFIALDLGAPGTAAYFAVAAPASVPSGTAFDLTVTALDLYGNPAVNYQGTVTFSTSDTDPGITLPADYSFTAADAGVHTFSGGVTLITPGDQTITATDAASGMTRTATITIVPPG